MHCEKLPTSQIGIYSIRIRTLNTLCFHLLIGEIAIRKDFLLKFFHKNTFLLQFDKKKKKIPFRTSTFFTKIK